MHRLILALALCTLLSASARMGPVPSGAVTTMAGVEACAVTSDSPDSDSSQQWRKAHAIAVVTASVWKSAPLHAGLGSIRVARLFELALFMRAPDPPAASTPHYLLHTPLLI